MNLKLSVEQDLSQRRAPDLLKDKQEFLNDAYSNLIKETMGFTSREEFDEFIAEMEMSYFRTSKLPMTPYKGPQIGSKSD
jgi:hypothetical protein